MRSSVFLTQPAWEVSSRIIFIRPAKGSASQTIRLFLTAARHLRGDRRPEAIIFDDAHVAEKLIRDSFTVKIEHDKLPHIYSRIVDRLRPHFMALHRSEYFDNIVSGASSYPVVAAPPSAVVALDRDRSLITALREAEQSDSTIGYALGHLADRLDKCAIFISQHTIRFARPFCRQKGSLFFPIQRFVVFICQPRSQARSIFCRAFGKQPSVRIEPESDAGMGERLIILADRENLTNGGAMVVSADTIARILSAKQKLLISTPSYVSAEKYKALARRAARR